MSKQENSEKQEDLNKTNEEENLKNENIEETEKNETKEKGEIKDMVPKQEFDDLNDRLKRLLAEFENFKKRSSKERESLYNMVLSDMVESILPVVDNLENAAKVETKDEGYKQGVDMVLKQFKDVLVQKGVTEIKTVGEVFNPEFHEAVSRAQNDEFESDVISVEFRKGYKIGNKVIRHSMVVVTE